MRTIGLVGGIGSGKSTVSKLLRELGAVVVDADSVGHDVYRPGTTGWKELVDAFGEGIVGADRTIDRKKLGAIVFAEEAQLRRLNAIVHPLIRDEVVRRIRAHRHEYPKQPIVLEAAILIEAGWVSLVDEVWLVTASRARILDRLVAQRGLGADDVARRMAAQIQDDQRRAHARVVIENDGSLAELRAQVEIAWRDMLRR